MSKAVIFSSFVLIVLALMLSESKACPGLFGMGGGGGGGCGCGAPRPPPPCGGGCGRKKREVLEQQVKTKETNPCPQSEWKKIMDSTITDDHTSSVYAIQGALHKAFEAKFFVTCIKVVEGEEGTPAAFVTNGEGYCSHGTKKVWCEAIALYA